MRKFIDTVEVQPYYGANWFTDRGVRLKRKLIEKRGLPDLTYWKMITVTFPDGVEDPKTLYELGKKRIPQFLARIREVYGKKFRWAWKLEFQENGNPHWHILAGIPEKIPEDFLDCFTEWWGYGRVNIRGIKRKEFEYLFKYVSKCSAHVCDSSSEIPLPDWVLDYRTVQKDGRVTAGIRFWQTGGGFYENRGEEDAEDEPESEKRPQLYSRVPYTIRQRWENWMRKGTVLIRDRDGQIRRSVQLNFGIPYFRVIQMVINELLNGNAAPAEGMLGFKCGISLILNEIDKCQKHRLKRILPFSSMMGMGCLLRAW